MKIGEAVASIEFSDAEKERIGEALRDPDSLPCRVMAQQVAENHDEDFWRRHQRAFDIQGFRPGAPAARQLVLKKVLDTLKRHTGPQPPSIWKFYRSCVIHFIVDDLAGLNKLLLDEELLDDERPLTDRVFSSIRRVMPLYNSVSEEQVRQLYVLWGFERTSDVDSILHDDALSASIAKRLLANEAKTLTGFLTNRMDVLADELRSDSDTQAAALDELRDRVQELASAEERRAEAAEKPPAPERRSDGGSPRAALVDETAKLLRELAATVRSHEKRLLELSPSKRESSGAAPTVKHGEETWENALGRVRASCRKAGFELKNATTARILVELLRRSRVVCCQETGLWLSVLTAYSTDVRWGTASPLWVEPQDWRESIAFMSDYNARARALVLMDFDVGLQEAYLLPTLRTWIASIPRVCEHRLVLTPASQSLDGVSPRVLEASLSVTSSPELIAQIERLAATPDHDLAPRWRQTAPSHPLAYEETSNNERELEVRKLFENLGTTIAAALARQFISLMQGIQDFVGESGAAAIASECTLLPWFRRTRGEGATRLLKETLISIYGTA
jgi:hypothetical protein